jgi:hypothetical protein
MDVKVIGCKCVKLESNSSGEGLVAGFCEYSNELLGITKTGNHSASEE